MGRHQSQGRREDAKGEGVRVIATAALEATFTLDPNTGELFWLAPPSNHAQLLGQVAGCPTSLRSTGKSYWTIQLNGRHWKRSHFVFALTHGRWPACMVDHINGNSLDDRPANLREATWTQNAWNHKRRAKRLSLPMGVKGPLASGHFQARISVNKKAIALGCFASAAEAAAAYQQARQQYFGEWA
jgi:hypothetical protein